MFPEEKRGPRIALVVLLVVLALIVVAVVALFAMPRGDGPAPTASPTASDGDADRLAPPVDVFDGCTGGRPDRARHDSSPGADPSVDQFRAQVQPRLDDASTGLDMAQGPGGDTAVQIVDSLQNDAQNLAGQAPPPRSRQRGAMA